MSTKVIFMYKIWVSLAIDIDKTVEFFVSHVM